MPILNQRDVEDVRRKLGTGLKRDVSITLYTQTDIGLYIPGRECPTCGPTQDLLEEVSALSARVHLEVVDIYKNVDEASSKGVQRIPALIIGSDTRDNVRYFGMPSGYEFAVLVDSIIAAARGLSGLKLETRRQLKRLDEDVHIQVFVTPSCGYCPGLARTAHAMAIESPRVTADVVEVQEFPDLARGYSVMSVPKTVINDRVQFVGAVSEDVLVSRVLQAVGIEEEDEVDFEPVTEQTTLIS